MRHSPYYVISNHIVQYIIRKTFVKPDSPLYNIFMTHACTSPIKKPKGRPKDPEKARHILDAAAMLFMQKSYNTISMEAIAKQAGVSKQTLYSHFDDKDDLFRASIKAKLSKHSLDQTSFIKSGDLEHDLKAIGARYVNLILDDEILCSRRTLMADGRDYPKTAQLFYDQGPGMVILQLSDFLESYDIPDARFYARAYLNMLEHEWDIKGMIGILTKPSAQEVTLFIAKTANLLCKMMATDKEKTR